LLEQAQHQYFLKLVIELFDFENIQQRLQYAAHLVYSNLSKLYPEWSSRYAAYRDKFRADVTEIGLRFQQQLNGMIMESPDYEFNEVIQERIRKGTDYFLQQLESYKTILLNVSDVEIDNKETRKLIEKAIANLTDDYLLKIATLRACLHGFSVSRYLSAKAKAQLEPALAPKRKRAERASRQGKGEDVVVALSDDIRHPLLFAALKKWRSEQAAQKGLPVYTILQQKALIGISKLLPLYGKKLLRIPGIGNKVLENYGQELLAIVDEYRATNGEETLR